ncbi:MAG: hypothetical protein QM760_00360 [Nibricoccus sp.]
MKKSLIVLILGAAVWFFFIRDTPARWKGMPAAKAPVQTTANLPAPFRHQGFTIKPLARYQISGVVLHRERYRFDAMSSICPIDLGLGWGSMSIAGVLNELKITQRGRFLVYSGNGCELPLEPEQITRSASNNHCLPADDKVRDQLLAIKRHEVATLEGYLVEVNSPDGGVWRTSLTRDDEDGGACEIIWVTSVSRRKI